MKNKGTTHEKQKKESTKNMFDYLFILVTLPLEGARGGYADNIF